MIVVEAKAAAFALAPTATSVPLRVVVAVENAPVPNCKMLAVVELESSLTAQVAVDVAAGPWKAQTVVEAAFKLSVWPYQLRTSLTERY
jgi:hypothetical protein